MQRVEDNFSVAELREFCRKLGLSTVGVKDDLIQRIFVYFSSTISNPNLSSNSNPPRIAFMGFLRRRLFNSNSPPRNTLFSLWDFPNFNGGFFERFKSWFHHIALILGSFGGVFALVQIYAMQFDREEKIIRSGFWH